MKPNILLILLLILTWSSSVFTADDTDKDAKKTLEEYKKELQVKFKDANADSLIEGAEKLEEYYKFTSASIFREIALEKLKKQKDEIEASLKKTQELLKQPEEETETPNEDDTPKDVESDSTETEKDNADLIKFAEIADKILKSKLILIQCQYDRCNYWLEQDKKGKDNSIIYVNIEKSIIVKKEKDFDDRIAEVIKYDKSQNFNKSDQKRILLKNALSRLTTFIDGKIKAYESTLKSIKRKKNLKDTTAQKKAEMRIEYYKWMKPFAEKITKELKNLVEAEMTTKHYEDLIYLYENYEKYSAKIDFPKHLTVSETDRDEFVKLANERIKHLKNKDKKNPE